MLDDVYYEYEEDLVLSCSVAVVCDGDKYLGVQLVPDSSRESALRALKAVMLQKGIPPEILRGRSVIVRFYVLEFRNDPDSPWLVDFLPPSLQEDSAMVLRGHDIQEAWVS